MRIKRLPVACVAVFVASISLSYAGPCLHEIDRVQAEIDAKLETLAAAGPSARESTAATMNRQPTPGSIAAAEARLGDVSARKVAALKAAMAEARAADNAGAQDTCDKALADVHRTLGSLQDR
jgi:hypothetical protein